MDPFRWQHTGHVHLALATHEPRHSNAIEAALRRPVEGLRKCDQTSARVDIELDLM